MKKKNSILGGFGVVVLIIVGIFCYNNNKSIFQKSYGYMNATDNKLEGSIVTCNDLSGSKTYVSGEKINNLYGNNWKVISDNGTSVTMILNGNYKTGSYGNNIQWKSGNNAYDVVNNTFKSEFLNAPINNGCIKYDYTSNSYVRLPYHSELSGSLSNASDSTFWTMSAFNDSDMILGDKDGNSSATYYELKELKPLYSGVSKIKVKNKDPNETYISNIIKGEYYLENDISISNLHMPVKNVEAFTQKIVILPVGGSTSYVSEIDDWGTKKWCDTGSLRSDFLDVNYDLYLIYATSDETCKVWDTYTLEEESIGSIGIRPVITVYKSY